MNILDPRRQWIPADRTDIRATLKAHGHTPPEQHAQQAEQEARHEGALRAMKRIQAEAPNVTPIVRARKAAK